MPTATTSTQGGTDANVDPGEINKFAEKAHLWWDKNSEFKPLHEINPLRIDYIKRYCDPNLSELLDVGCGGGILSEGLAHQGARVTGIDLAQESINIAQLHALESELEIDYEFVSAESYAANNPERFDIVTCMEMLEHVPDPASIVKSCAELTKPDGMVFFSTINRNKKSWLFAIAGAEHILKLLPKGTHDFERFIKPSELAHFARDANLEVLDVSGMSYNPLTQQYKLNKDVDVNYLMACRKL